jgi:hypothetical protein
MFRSGLPLQDFSPRLALIKLSDAGVGISCQGESVIFHDRRSQHVTTSDPTTTWNLWRSGYMVNEVLPDAAVELKKGGASARPR